MDFIISLVGVAVFTGLTAYDVQKLKRIGAGMEYSDVSVADTNKLSIMGALTLYLDFINLFLFLLRLFGNRRD
jgi:FtsH-binding integral membrane protein